MGRSLCRFWDRNVAGGEFRERVVGSVEGKSTSLADGDVNPERPIEIRMKSE